MNWVNIGPLDSLRGGVHHREERHLSWLHIWFQERTPASGPHMAFIGGGGWVGCCCMLQGSTCECLGKIRGSGARTAHPTPLTTPPSGSVLDTSLTVST